uniref:Uncharacterized protein n=1 Tax=Glossina palpalis gambiensis TaxID=67801 RepID=A0A1B0BAI6_9MUSC
MEKYYRKQVQLLAIKFNLASATSTTGTAFTCETRERNIVRRLNDGHKALCEYPILCGLWVVPTNGKYKELAYRLSSELNRPVTRREESIRLKVAAIFGFEDSILDGAVPLIEDVLGAITKDGYLDSEEPHGRCFRKLYDED